MSPLNLALLLSLNWWVATPEEAQALQAAADQYWDGAPLDIQVGSPAPGAPGIHVADGQLIWLEDTRAVQQPCPSSPGAQVLLVKSWTQALEPADQGWVPEPELEDFLPDPPPGPVPVLVPSTGPEKNAASAPEVTEPERPPATRQVNLTAGVGLQDAFAAEPWRLGIEGTRYGHTLNQALWLTADLGGRPKDAGAPTQRVGPQLAFGVSRDGLQGGAGELWVFGGARALVYQGQAQALLPGAGIRMRGWGPALGNNTRIGVSLTAQLEGLEQQRSFYDGPTWVTTMSRQAAYLEFVIGVPT